MHAKSTAVTHIYTLASVLFRASDYVLIVSDTEGQAKEFLNNIRVELQDNEDLIKMFGVAKFSRDSATDIIVDFNDGEQFRILVKGSEQKLRGLNWRGKRPNLIVGDDLENDEIVMNDDRREKFRHWFYSALLPCGSDYCKFRIVGTVLHLDALLERLLNDDTWEHRRYKAHNADFTKILWKEKFPRHVLEKIRRRFVNQGFPEGYSQEYLNNPIDEDTAFFRADDLRPASEEQLSLPGDYYLGVDLAISEKDRSAFTAMVVVKRLHNGDLVVVDAVRGRWDSKEIIDQMFAMVIRYKIDMVIIESEKVDKALGPYIADEMMNRSVYFSIEKKVPTQDKVQRARPIQAIARSGKLFVSKEGGWYPDFEHELLTFPRGAYKDQVDALAWIGLTLNKIYEGNTLEEEQEEEWMEEMESSEYMSSMINPLTGY